MLTQELDVKETAVVSDEKKSDWKPTPIETVHPEHVDPKNIRLFKEPDWILRLTIEGDRSYLRVKVVRAAPLTQPDRYFCFLDAKDEVVSMITELSEVDATNHPLIKDELDRRYLTAQIQTIRSIQNEYGVSYWHVDTDRGTREFVAKSVSENAQWLSDRRLVIFDVDGNRFEVADMTKLDRRSHGLLESVL